MLKFKLVKLKPQYNIFLEDSERLFYKKKFGFNQFSLISKKFTGRSTPPTFLPLQPVEFFMLNSFHSLWAKTCSTGYHKDTEPFVILYSMIA